MSVKFALLILMDKEPASGYDLAQRFNRGIGQFWQASHQQIYQQLKKMHEQGFVQFTVQKQQGKPDRKVYEITAAGEQDLNEWLAAQEKPPTVRDALLIKIYAASRGDPQRLLNEVQRHIQLHETQLVAHLQEEQQFFSANKTMQRKLRWPYITLRRGIRYEQEWIEWLKEVQICLVDDSLPLKPLRPSL